MRDELIAEGVTRECPAALSVRVGLGWSPFEGDGLADGRFWRAVAAMEELGYDSSGSATRRASAAPRR